MYFDARVHSPPLPLTVTRSLPDVTVAKAPPVWGKLNPKPQLAQGRIQSADRRNDLMLLLHRSTREQFVAHSEDREFPRERDEPTADVVKRTLDGR